jgi:O-acetyl-ADP-ribose deacetylase (regulator of RNase III)
MSLPVRLEEDKDAINLFIGERKLSMFHGSVVSLEADAMVCPVDQSLDFRSGVARIISQAAGPTLRSERPTFAEPYGKVIVLPGGNLKVKYIFLSVLLGERGIDKMKLSIRQSVERTIRYAEFLRLNSIAFPVLGCPKTNPPYNFVAREMMEDVVQYFKCRNTKLKAILSSVFNQTAFDAFRREARDIADR